MGGVSGESLLIYGLLVCFVPIYVDCRWGVCVFWLWVSSHYGCQGLLWWVVACQGVGALGCWGVWAGSKKGVNPPARPQPRVVPPAMPCHAKPSHAMPGHWGDGGDGYYSCSRRLDHHAYHFGSTPYSIVHLLPGLLPYLP